MPHPRSWLQVRYIEWAALFRERVCRMWMLKRA